MLAGFERYLLRFQYQLRRHLKSVVNMNDSFRGLFKKTKIEKPWFSMPTLEKQKKTKQDWRILRVGSPL